MLKLTPNSTPQTDAFVQAYEAATAPNPLSSAERIWDGTIKVGLRPFGGKIHMSSIESMEPGAGKASQFLKWAIDQADECGVDITGGIKPFGDAGLNLDELSSWYKRFGFDVSPSGEMIRQHKNPEPTQGVLKLSI